MYSWEAASGPDRVPVKIPYTSGRLLIIYYSTHSVCGIGSWLETLSPELEALGWDVTVGLAWGSRFHLPERVERARPKLKFVRMDGRTGTEQGRIEAIAETILRTEPDVVVLNCLQSGFEGARLARSWGANFKLVATNHGNFAHQAACLLEHREELDLCVCIGKKSLAAMTARPWGFAAERICHLANAVKTATTSFARANLPFRIGFAARLDSEKRKRICDLVTFVRAMPEKLPDCELWIAGTGDMEEELRANAASSRIRFFGALTRDELYSSFYPHLHAFINFSDNEAFGLSIAESMAHGAVPVTSLFSGLYAEGLVRPNHNALTFPIGDLDAAFSNIRDLIADQELWLQMSNSAKEHIQSHFSPQTSAQEWNRQLSRVRGLPVLPFKPLDRVAGKWGVPESLWERFRRLAGRKVQHSSAGEEWPHYHSSNREILTQMTALLAAEDAASAVP